MAVGAALAASVGTFLSANAATISSVTGAVASAASAGTSIAGAIQSDKAQKAQLKLMESQSEEEKRARDAARKAALARVQGGVSGNILASSGLGGSTATSAGKSTLLGGT